MNLGQSLAIAAYNIVRFPDEWPSCLAWNIAFGATLGTAAYASTPHLKKPLSAPERIIRSVAHYYGLSAAALRSPARTRNLVHPRDMAMYAIRHHTQASYPSIAQLFSGRHHTTVMHAIRKVEDQLVNEGRTRAEMMALDGIIREQDLIHVMAEVWS